MHRQDNCFNITDETEKLKKLRKCKTLEKLEFNQWTKDELLDLINNYIIYFEKNIKCLNIIDFVKKGIYRQMSSDEIENLKIEE